jgi:hypothetical protein
MELPLKFFILSAFCDIQSIHERQAKQTRGYASVCLAALMSNMTTPTRWGGTLISGTRINKAYPGHPSLSSSHLTSFSNQRTRSRWIVVPIDFPT